MDLPILLLKTVLLRPYVFIFLGMFLLAASRLWGRRRTALFFVITWATAFMCEYASTRTGIPFGWYHYTGSTVGQELYLSNIPFMDSLSFTFLLYASYCLALLFVLPASPQLDGGRAALVFDPASRRSRGVLLLTAVLYAFVDVVIDPVALRGDRWFLGQIYGYAEAGIYFGVPISNFLGWGVVGLIALGIFFMVDRRLADAERDRPVTTHVLLGCSLYYAVLGFNLVVTFAIDEPLLGTTGIFIHLPILVLALLRVSHYPLVAVSRTWR